jgi:hypothetical protein
VRKVPLVFAAITDFEETDPNEVGKQLKDLKGEQESLVT